MRAEPLAVLLVDDDDDLREALMEFLQRNDMHVEQASNGRDALASLRAARPAVVLLDMMMPGMSGADVRDAMKGDPALADIPIVVMSAQPERALPDLPFMRKPLATDALIRVLREAAGST